MANNIFPHPLQAKKPREWAESVPTNHQLSTSVQVSIQRMYRKSHLLYIFAILYLTIQGGCIHSHKAADHSAVPHSLHNNLKKSLNNCTVMVYFLIGTGFLDKDISSRNPHPTQPCRLNGNCQLRSELVGLKKPASLARATENTEDHKKIIKNRKKPKKDSCELTGPKKPASLARVRKNIENHKKI